MGQLAKTPKIKKRNPKTNVKCIQIELSEKIKKHEKGKTRNFVSRRLKSKERVWPGGSFCHRNSFFCHRDCTSRQTRGTYRRILASEVQVMNRRECCQKSKISKRTAFLGRFAYRLIWQHAIHDIEICNIPTALVIFLPTEKLQELNWILT